MNNMITRFFSKKKEPKDPEEEIVVYLKDLKEKRKEAFIQLREMEKQKRHNEFMAHTNYIGGYGSTGSTVSSGAFTVSGTQAMTGSYDYPIGIDGYYTIESQVTYLYGIIYNAVEAANGVVAIGGQNTHIRKAVSSALGFPSDIRGVLIGKKPTDLLNEVVSIASFPEYKKEERTSKLMEDNENREIFNKEQNILNDILNRYATTAKDVIFVFNSKERKMLMGTVYEIHKTVEYLNSDDPGNRNIGIQLMINDADPTN